MESEARTIEVFMDQNNKCNLKCRMCGFSDPRVAGLPKYDLPMAVFRRIAEQVLPKASYLALSCMTEPLMTRDFGRAARDRRAVRHPVRGSRHERHAPRRVDLPPARRSPGLAPRGLDRRRDEGGLRGDPDRVELRARDGERSEVQGDPARDGRVLPELRINHVLSETNIARFEEFLALAESLEAEAIDVRSIARFSNALDTGTSSGSFFEQICRVRERIDQWCAQTGVKNLGVLRWQPTLIEIFDDAGRKLRCRRPWNTVAIHANGDVMPCISWTRAPFGNIAGRTST